MSAIILWFARDVHFVCAAKTNERKKRMNEKYKCMRVNEKERRGGIKLNQLK